MTSERDQFYSNFLPNAVLLPDISQDVVQILVLFPLKIIIIIQLRFVLLTHFAKFIIEFRESRWLCVAFAVLKLWLMSLLAILNWLRVYLLYINQCTTKELLERSVSRARHLSSILSVSSSDYITASDSGSALGASSSRSRIWSNLSLIYPLIS